MRQEKTPWTLQDQSRSTCELLWCQLFSEPGPPPCSNPWLKPSSRCADRSLTSNIMSPTGDETTATMTVGAASPRGLRTTSSSQPFPELHAPAAKPTAS